MGIFSAGRRGVHFWEKKCPPSKYPPNPRNRGPPPPGAPGPRKILLRGEAPRGPKSGTRGRAALLINVFFGARKKRVLICAPPHEISENPDRRARGGPRGTPRKPGFWAPRPGGGNSRISGPPGKSLDFPACKPILGYTIGGRRGNSPYIVINHHNLVRVTIVRLFFTPRCLSSEEYARPIKPQDKEYKRYKVPIVLYIFYIL